MSASERYLIGIPVYDGVDLLDLSAPYELFNWMAQLEPSLNPRAPTREVRVISLDGPSVTTRDKLPLGGNFPLFSDHTDPIDLLWVPGGDPRALQRLMLDDTRMDWLRQQGEAAQFAVSVCEGALLSAAAGLLDGYRATTHWAFLACLKLFPQIEVVPGYPRFEIDRQRITGGGISSGLDEALKIIELLSSKIVAETVQLTIQYNPRPPVNSGDPSVARPPVYNPGDGSTCSFPGMAGIIAQVLERKT